MKAPSYVAAISFLAVVAFAQNPAQPEPTPPAKDSKATNTASAPKQDNGSPLEMKTRNYSGILADASCVTTGSTTMAAAGSGKPAPDTTAASGAATTAKTAAGDADRAAPADAGQSCSVSASTTQFAIKLKDGQIVKLDDVGNQRAQAALKDKKKWSEAAASGKSIQVDANGVLNGDQLITMSIK